MPGASLSAADDTAAGDAADPGSGGLQSLAGNTQGFNSIELSRILVSLLLEALCNYIHLRQVCQTMSALA